VGLWRLAGRQIGQSSLTWAFGEFAQAVRRGQPSPVRSDRQS